MDPLMFYAAQSRITDPGPYAPRFADLPSDVAGLCGVVQGLVLHYRSGPLDNDLVQADRLAEIDLRYVARMLDRLFVLDDRSLVEPRAPEKRLVGCCRDFAVLLCSLARARGIPARVRVGFATYFAEDFCHDHAIAEVWDADERRWRLVDPEIGEELHPANPLAFDARDVPRDQFLVGGLAWQLCREKRAIPEKFGVGPDEEAKGWWFIRHKLIQDLAALNKQELLLWDCWGLMEDGPTETDLALLDGVAILTQGGNETFSGVRAVYEREPGLRVPAVVNSYSPVAPPDKVVLGF
ncbi:MAG: transglutaminase-like domain-containing protein [Chloroflexota bacterium]